MWVNMMMILMKLKYSKYDHELMIAWMKLMLNDGKIKLKIFKINSLTVTRRNK